MSQSQFFFFKIIDPKYLFHLTEMINLYKQQKLSNIKINADELGFLEYQFSVDKIEFIEIMISIHL